jgi:hypothetical protein
MINDAYQPIKTLPLLLEKKHPNQPQPSIGDDK